MKRLFEISPDYTVELNREWIGLIPEFQALIKRDKGSPGDYRGEKKLKARRELAFIYFMLDFASPIYDWEETDRRVEAMKYTDLKESDIDEVVMEAYNKYQELVLKSAPILDTLAAVKKMMQNLNNYFEDVDFSELTPRGELRHKPEAAIKAVTMLPKFQETVEKIEKQVMEQLKNDTGIRGKAKLGGRENAPEEWNEGKIGIPLKDDIDLNGLQ